MAYQWKPLPLIIILSLLLIAISLSEVNGLGGGEVGGRKKIENVESNKEVQSLGKYSVREYNSMQHKKGKNGGGSGDLKFSKVVEAEQQVVSGIKYYLTIAAVTPAGVSKRFEAVVVVKPWLKFKELLGFHPSPATI